MIRLIVAIDSKNGIANDYGIPWQGKLPTDVSYFRDKTLGRTILMGGTTYREFKKPLPDRNNLVLTTDKNLRPGFEKVNDLSSLLNKSEDFWVIGGAGIFAQTIEHADELYITRLEGDFRCTKFFPEFENEFEIAEETASQTENGITFRFQIWKRK